MGNLLKVNRYTTEESLKGFSQDWVKGLLHSQLEQAHCGHKCCYPRNPFEVVNGFCSFSEQYWGVSEGTCASLQDRSTIEDVDRERHVHDRFTREQVRSNLLDDVLYHILLGIHDALVDEHKLILLVEPPITFLKYEVILQFVMVTRLMLRKIETMANIVPVMFIQGDSIQKLFLNLFAKVMLEKRLEGSDFLCWFGFCLLAICF